MIDTVTVYGGHKLRGSVELIPNKNSFLPALAASLLSSQPVTYFNVPKTSDIQMILHILAHLGANIEVTPLSTIVDCSSIHQSKIPLLDGKAIRASILLAGPLLARFGHAEVPLPGGCTLGHRSIASHVEVFSKLGILARFEGDGVRFEEPKGHSLDAIDQVFIREASVTATENAMMYLAGKRKAVQLYGAAAEPHIVDLSKLLCSLGVNLKGAGSNRIDIQGKDCTELASASFRCQPDFVDFCGYTIAAAITDGEIRIQHANFPEVVDVLMDWLELFHIEFIREGTDILVRRMPGKPLHIDPNGSFPMAGPRMPKLYPRPWPGFPVDCIPMMIPLAAKMESGQLLITNWMYENGLSVTRELSHMGAAIFEASPQRLVINARDSEFKGETTVTPPLVIQSVKSVFLAALASTKGSKTSIRNFHLLKRRYPDIVEKFTSLGAKIEAS